MKPERPISVLVIDDSAANRRALTEVLDAAPGIKVVDRAGDGEEGLKKAMALRPDVITLDLEMPRMDGFAFLRLLTARAPTPVIVISSYGHPSDVFKALQLGAFDFIAKPSGAGRSPLEAVRGELIEKVRSVRFARQKAAPPPSPPLHRRPIREEKPSMGPEGLLLAIGASTGGPPAVQKVLTAVAGLPVAVVVAQHMPPRFTQAFAERLDKALPFRVREAADGEPLAPGQVVIAPGGQHLEVLERRGSWALRVTASSPGDRHAPSVDRLFESVARAAGERAAAVVLTGMGSDGAVGVEALGAAGCAVWAESEKSAVVFGMPEAAIATGRVAHVLDLDALGPHLAHALEARVYGPRRAQGRGTVRGS